MPVVISYPSANNPDWSPSAGRRTATIICNDAEALIRDQIEDILAHVRDGLCSCDACDRYKRIADIAMEPFGEPERVLKAGVCD